MMAEEVLSVFRSSLDRVKKNTHFLQELVNTTSRTREDITQLQVDANSCAPDELYDHYVDRRLFALSPRLLGAFGNFWKKLHRLLWMHPFMDGNGRVARLMSHAMLLDILDTGAVWSVASGLARNVQEYRTLLANCDVPRRNDLDGRGTLSQEALADFSRFFLMVCTDQVIFMDSLMQPDRLRTRILLWAEEEIRLGRLPAKSTSILEAVLYRGELPRGDADIVVGTGERQARRIVSALVDKGVLVSENPRAPLRLAFPAALASRWMPGLFPEKAANDATSTVERIDLNGRNSSDYVSRLLSGVPGGSDERTLFSLDQERAADVKMANAGVSTSR